jgi:predicted RNase H-like HicB family nuclease
MKYIALSFRFYQEEGRWLARCEELGTSTYGDSLPEAEANLKEAVLLHLNTLEDVGECKRFLKENNIHLLDKRPKEISVTYSDLSDPAYYSPYIHPIKEALHLQQ